MRILHLIDSDEGRSRLRPIAERLLAGDSPASFPDDEGRQVVAATVLDALDGDGPLLVRSRPSRPAALIDWSLVFPRAGWPALQCLCAGVWQVLDAWDASHEAAQEAEDQGERSLSPYWHAIAHRREPDPGNAAYWFRRVGRHAIFPTLAAEARHLSGPDDPAALARCLPGGSWDAMAFISYCGDAARRPGSGAERLARRLQRAEMVLLLEATVDACRP